MPFKFNPLTGKLDIVNNLSKYATIDYVDSGTWLMPPIIEWYDPVSEEGLPVDPEIGDRYGADSTGYGWTIDYIYEWDGTEWIEESPEEGWTLWDLFGLMMWVFFSGGWMPIGSISEYGTATGQMAYWNNDYEEWMHTETSELFWDDTNKRIGIGTTSPTSKLHVVGSADKEQLIVQSNGTQNDDVAQIGDVSAGNYTAIEDDGTVKFVGDATVWDDLRTPISVAKAIPGKEPAEVVYKGGIVYEFENGTDEGCAFNVQLPHDYKEGSDIECHIHMLIRTSGAGIGAENVKWDFTHSWSNIGDAQPTETAVPATIDVQNDTADTHYLKEIAATITGTGKRISSMLICSLTRDVSVANNYTDDVLVMEVDFHYEKDTVGSRTESSK